jgi:hypothetical protein
MSVCSWRFRFDEVASRCRRPHESGLLAVGLGSHVQREWLGLQLYYYGSMVLMMPRGNPAVKLAVTVDADVHAKVLHAAEAEGTSVSAWITEAARRALLVRDGLAAVAEWEAEHGVLTQAELGAARTRIERNTTRRKRSRR